MHKRGVRIVTLALVLVLAAGTAAMAATGSLTRIESKWLDLQEMVMKRMVKEGRITQEQADEELGQMREHLRASETDDVYTRISHRMGMRLGLMGIMTDAWAELTGQAPKDVRHACREQDSTVWEMAKQAGREDELKEKILALAEEKLNAWVQDGKLTDEKKTKILDGMREKLDDGDFPSGFMGPRGCPRRND